VPATSNAAASKSEDYDISELDISFEKVARTQESKTGATETNVNQDQGFKAEQTENKLTEE
jgi:hypothetical protein